VMLIRTYSKPKSQLAKEAETLKSIYRVTTNRIRYAFLVQVTHKENTHTELSEFRVFGVSLPEN